MQPLVIQFNRDHWLSITGNNLHLTTVQICKTNSQHQEMQADEIALCGI